MKKIISGVAVIAILATSIGFGPKPAAANFADGTGDWADTVYSYLPGTQKDGSALSADMSNAWQALGIAESDDTTTVPATTSGVALGYRGQITIQFANTVQNKPGADIRIVTVHDATYVANKKRPAPGLRIRVEVSQNCWDWKVVGWINRDTNIDLGAYRYAKCIQLTDRSNPRYKASAQNGFIIDGIQALHTTADQIWSGAVHDRRWYYIDDNKDNDVWQGQSLKTITGTGFCNALWDQAITFNDNWLANPVNADQVDFQHAYYSTVGRSAYDGKTTAQIYAELSTMTCDRYSQRIPAMNDLYLQLQRINKGYYLWTSATPTDQ